VAAAEQLQPVAAAVAAAELLPRQFEDVRNFPAGTKENPVRRKMHPLNPDSGHVQDAVQDNGYWRNCIRQE